MDEKLTKEDWIEIYYALDTKAYNIYEDAKWAAHLRNIMEKIGPDGENMYVDYYVTGELKPVGGKRS
jgi:hypothetical protein